MFAWNHWYVAALSAEITATPLGRTILGEPVVLYRLADGRPVALADRCPHRRYPLSLGCLDGDHLVCGYHGFAFDAEGRCVAVPGQAHVPARANVASYPLVEQGAWAWIFMGDAGRADEVEIPPTPWLTEPGWAVLSGMAPLRARVELLIDNLLDLSHETYLHAGFIGTPEVARTPIDSSVGDDGVVRVWRHMDAVACPPFYAASTGLSGAVDRWQDIEYFAPGFYLLHARIARAGLAPGGDDAGAFHMKILYGLTPSTDSATYDFWALARDFAIDDAEVDRFLEAMQVAVVRQDVDALDVLEQRVRDDPDAFEVSVRSDRGGLAARRAYAAACAAPARTEAPHDVPALAKR
ncbi:MAG: aromatic ring-hydroxylating dioxygenase subunit alpha [Actinomycetota bacterium]|nr:aromatic ring-hydroxylating dioxygenase subunit alpha [Actinomycetota bacterium]